MRKIFLSIFFLILFVGIVSAEFNPRDNITGKNTYWITDFVGINASYFYGNGSGLTGITETYTKSEVNAINTSMKNYVDSQDLIFNNSNNNYIIEVNNTLANWIISNFVQISNIVNLVGNWSADKINYYTSTQVNEINTSVNNYILSNNDSVNNYIIYVNGTAKAYTDAISLAYNDSNNNYALVLNDSNNNYILYTNGTMQSYVDAVNLAINNSNNNYAIVLNTSNNNYILFVNGTMKDYVDGTFITQVNEGNLNVNSSTWWADVSGWVSGWFMKTGDDLKFNETKFNETIDSKLLGEHWFFTEEDLIYGTADGTLSLTWQFDDYDSISYNLTETTPQGLEYYANTSNNITINVNRICIRYKAVGDNFAVSLWNDEISSWEGYMTLYTDTIFNWLCKEIRDSSDHLVDDKIMMRIIHTGSASLQHKLQIDAMYVSSGYTPRIGNEVDPHSFHINENLNNSGYNITADNFFGEWNGSLLYLLKSQWNATNTSYYLASNPSGFYNVTSNIGNWTNDKGSYTLLSVLNNGTYVISSILNNGTYANVMETDPKWGANYTNLQTDCGDNVAYGIFPNGTIKCKSIEAGAEIDPKWTANWTAFNSSWSSTYNATTNDSINNYISSNNVSIVNWANSVFVQIANIINLVGNWSADKSSYYTSSQVDDINTSMKNYVDNIGEARWDANYSLVVPYTGATTDLDLGENNLNILGGAIFLGTPTTMAIYTQEQDVLNIDTSSQTADLDFSLLTNNRVFTFPDTSGTLFLTSQWNATNTSYMEGSNFTLQNISMKNYVDAQNTSQTNYINAQNTSVTNALGTKLSLSGGTMTGNLNMSTKNITMNGNGVIYSNATCIAMKSSTVTFLIC